jgi:phosphate-selective porin OprO and OprP
VRTNPVPRSRLLVAVSLYALWGVCAGVANAQEPKPAADLEQRVRDLEQRLQQPSAIPSVLNLFGSSVGEAKDGGQPFTSGWNNGFFIQSPDKQFVLRITGQIQTDYRAYLDKGDNTDIDTFLLRRARLGIESDVAQHYEFRFLPDFGQGQATIQDSYLNVHYWDAFQVEAGKFKQPFSYEQLIQDRYVPTNERSLIDQLVPARDVGVMLQGEGLFDHRFDWAVSVSDGEINGNSDLNNHKDVAARLAFYPFGNDECESVWKRLEFGVSATTGIEGESLANFVYRTPAQIPWLQFNPNVSAFGLRTRLSPEMSYFYHGFGFLAQYFREDQDLRNAAMKSSIDVPTQGFFVLTTLLLTGESRTKYSEQVKPLADFDLRHPLSNPGAWELVGRVSRLQVASQIFTPGALRLADPSRFSDGATEMTLGFNWYLNPWVRTQVNYEHSWFDQGVLLGVNPNKQFRQHDALLLRLQVIF